MAPTIVMPTTGPMPATNRRADRLRCDAIKPPVSTMPESGSTTTTSALPPLATDSGLARVGNPTGAVGVAVRRGGDRRAGIRLAIPFHGRQAIGRAARHDVRPCDERPPADLRSGSAPARRATSRAWSWPGSWLIVSRRRSCALAGRRLSLARLASNASAKPSRRVQWSCDSWFPPVFRRTSATASLLRHRRPRSTRVGHMNRFSAWQREERLDDYAGFSTLAGAATRIGAGRAGKAAISRLANRVRGA